MKKAINTCVTLSLSFIVFLFLVGFTKPLGIASYAVSYIAAFALPLLAFLTLVRNDREIETCKLSVSLSASDARLFLPALLPSVALIILASFITTLLFSVFGIRSTSALEGSLPTVFIIYAVVPALGEEILFRYVPIRLIAPHSRKAALVVSASLFALVHVNLLQMPYAFVAGLVFAAVDLMTGSILPSVILHLINNVLAVLWQLYGWSDWLIYLFIPLAVLTAASIVFLTVKRKAYVERLKSLWHGELSFTRTFTVFTILAVAYAAFTVSYTFINSK